MGRLDCGAVAGRAGTNTIDEYDDSRGVLLRNSVAGAARSRVGTGIIVFLGTHHTDARRRRDRATRQVDGARPEFHSRTQTDPPYTLLSIGSYFGLLAQRISRLDQNSYGATVAALGQ